MTSRDEVIREMASMGLRGDLRRLLMIVCAALVLAGALTFLAGVLGGQPERAWQTYLINYVFWTGLSFGAILFSVVLTLVNGRWGQPMRRLAESLGAFLPVAFVLFWGLYIGRERLFSWVHHPVHAKETWLSSGFLFARDGLALLLLTGVAAALVYISVRRDMDALAQGNLAVEGARTRRDQGRLVVLSVVYAVLYGFLMSLLAFDLIMSLSPHWYSTLFGAYYFVGSFYVGLAAVMLLSGIAVKVMGFGRFIGPQQFHDLANLLLGFCLITADFFYAQFLVIWYGNIPEETEFVIRRVELSPWEPLAWTVLLVCFALPFVVLLVRKIKRRPAMMMALCGIILVGMWFERLLLVAPSIWKGGGLPFGITELLITAGFLGAVGLCALAFLQRFPMLPVSDPLFLDQLERARAQGHT